jgi:hypothetical protein
MPRRPRSERSETIPQQASKPDFSVRTFDLGDWGEDGRWRPHFELKPAGGTGSTWLERLNKTSGER